MWYNLELSYMSNTGEVVVQKVVGFGWHTSNYAMYSNTLVNNGAGGVVFTKDMNGVNPRFKIAFTQTLYGLISVKGFLGGLIDWGSNTYNNPIIIGTY